MQVAVYQSAAAGLTPHERLGRLRTVLKGTDADLVLCPELFMSGYAVADALAQYAEPADGPFARKVAELAAETNTAIAYGYPEAAQADLYNSAQCIAPDGTVLANHRKLAIPPGPERQHFAPGAGLSLFKYKGITFGILICYDVEFPEAMRATCTAGAQAVLVPTALSAAWPVVAQRVVPSRAFENGAYLLYANHAGSEGDVTYLGESCIVGPDGADLARAADRETLITADLDLAHIAAARARLPYLSEAAGMASRCVSNSSPDDKT